MSTNIETHEYGITRTVPGGYDETIARLRELLKEEGFGVLTEIDVKRTLKEKIDKDVEPYVILGACNPRLAARSLELEPDIGLLLPCNVIVSTRGGETIARLRELLKEEGFGVLTEIDVKRTLKEKIDKDVEPYVILGACNPKLAARSLELEPDIGLLLPCNVIVSTRGGETHVGVVNPQSMVEFTSNPALTDVAREADERLRRVIERL